MPLPEDVHPAHSPTDTILESPEQLHLFRLLQIKYSLKVEIDTGLRHSRGSILKLANDVLLAAERIQAPLCTKKAAFDAISQYIEERTSHLET